MSVSKMLIVGEPVQFVLETMGKLGYRRQDYLHITPSHPNLGSIRGYKDLEVYFLHPYDTQKELKDYLLSYDFNIHLGKPPKKENQMQQRESKEQYFLKIARLVATRSTCPRRSVGCVIINKHKHIIATGYNGVPKGYPHCIHTPCGGQDFCSGQGLDSCMATHAEQNALLQCPNVMEIDTIFITDSPCIVCAKLIANTSCRNVVYEREYKDPSGINMLHKLGIATHHERIKD